MRSAPLAVAALLAAGVALSAQAPAVPARPSLDAIYRAYAAGDVDVVARSVRTVADIQSIRGDLFNAVGRWKREWSRTPVVFLIEIATLGLNDPDAPPNDLLRAVRELVAARPTRIGASPEEDNFELLVHHTAISMLIGAGQVSAADTYLTEVGSRVASTSQPVANKLSAPRLLFYRALTEDLRSRASGTYTPSRSTLLHVAEVFDASAAEPDNVYEARIRRAHALARAGDAAAAAALLGSSVPAADLTLEFWRLMVLANAEVALGRSAQAEAHYRQAAVVAPDAQTPLTALSALLVAGGRTDEAHALAAEARRQPPRAADPWWSYWNGDLRFFRTWIAALRRQAGAS